MDKIKNYIIDDLVKDNLVKYLSWRIGYFCFLLKLGLLRFGMWLNWFFGIVVFYLFLRVNI